MQCVIEVCWCQGNDGIMVREVAVSCCQIILLSAIKNSGRNPSVTHDLPSGDGSNMLTAG